KKRWRNILIEIFSSSYVLRIHLLTWKTSVHSGWHRLRMIQRSLVLSQAISGYKQTGSSHPSEYHFVEDYLAPKIRNIWEMLDGDIDKIFAQIEKPMFKKDVMNNVSAGAVTLVAHNGKSISWAVGDTASEYKWGWVSHNY